MDRAARQLVIAALLLTAGAATAAEWPQWGGPGRDFRVADPGLASDWPAAGLEPLWSRPLGEGYSGIAVADGLLYTLYGAGDEEEVVVALAAATGEEVWSRRYTAPRPEGMRLNYGEGPHATPLVAGGRLFAVGTTGQLLALDAASGRLLWRRDLWGEFGGYRLRRGYAASPIAHRGAVIVPVGGEGPGVVAFDQEDGKVVWQSEPFDSAQSSPILVEHESGEQLVIFIQDEVLGLDAADGAIRWRHPHKVFGPYNISTPLTGPPVDGPGVTLFVSSSYGGGSRMLRLGDGAGGEPVEELWHSKRMGIHFTNAVRLGGYVYGSTGRSGVMVAAVDAGSGELAWKDRSIGRANYLVVGERVLALEADGRLLLAELGPEGPAILAATQLLDSQSWTVPTLVGHTLYIRDRQRVLAVELPLAVP